MPHQPESRSNHETNDNLVIGIAIPAYNAASFIERTLQSVINQTDQHWRLAIVDDGSTDDTFRIVSRYAEQDSRITIIHQENGGTASALNASIHALTTEWVAYLGADDEFSLKYIETMRTAITENPGFLYYACNLQIILPYKTTLMSESREIISYDLDKYLSKVPFSFGGAVTRKALYEQIGYFDEAEYAEDLDLLLRILILDEKGIQIPETLIICHQEHEHRKSGDIMPQFKSEVKIFASFLDTYSDHLTGGQIYGICQEISKLIEAIATRDSKITNQNKTEGYQYTQTISSDAPHWKQALYHAAAALVGSKRASAFAQKLK